MKLRLATRRSPLALAQTRWVAARLGEAHPGLEVEEVPVVTLGDKVIDKPLATIGGKGLFINEVEARLVAGDADLAVHSMKDVPDALADGMDIVAMPVREDPRDVLVTTDGVGLHDLAPGTVVGTSSLRRAVQLHAARPDLRFAVFRGNVGTRLKKLEAGEVGAAVLAYSGLKRLGLDASVPHVALAPSVSLPAVGQGALGIEGPTDRPDLAELLAPLEHETTRLAVEAERAYLALLQGSCTTPLAAHAAVAGRALEIEGMVGAVDGTGILRERNGGPLDGDSPTERRRLARELGRALAARLLDQGAGGMVEAAQRCEDPYAVGPYAA
ncbi:MAG: hydroxymethylbilane synthase [Sandaracinaceae bacterium]